jgi:hypothetical protein
MILLLLGSDCGGKCGEAVGNLVDEGVSHPQLSTVCPSRFFGQVFAQKMSPQLSDLFEASEKN